MYCKNCGFKMKEEDIFCTNCGYNNSQKRNYSYEQVKNKKANIGLLILSFWFPIIGLVLYLVMKPGNPKCAKSYGKLALIGAVIRIIFVILCFGLNFLSFEYYKNNYNDIYWNSDFFNDYDEDELYYFDYAVSYYAKLASGKFYQELYENNTLTSGCYDIDDLEDSDYYDGSIEVKLVEGKIQMIIWLTDYEYYISAVDYDTYDTSQIQEGSKVEKVCTNIETSNSL